MDKNLILSKLRIEIRRSDAAYSKEKSVIRWVKHFFNESDITHSSQLKSWHIDHYLFKMMNNPDYNDIDFTQAKAAIKLLYDKVLNETAGFMGVDAF